MNNILFLVSGEGGLLKFIESCIEHEFLPRCTINAVIADRDCGAVAFAKRKGIAYRVVKYSVANYLELLTAMNSVEFDVAITTILKILHPNIVNNFEGKLINVHPALLPAFEGRFHATEVAVKHGVKFVGTTVHYVSNEVDAGEIIAQSVTPIENTELLDFALDIQFRSYCLSLLNVLLRFFNNNANEKTDSYNKTIFNPPLCFETDRFTESFWNVIKRS